LRRHVDAFDETSDSLVAQDLSVENLDGSVAPSFSKTVAHLEFSKGVVFCKQFRINALLRIKNA
jgi:hypothetical protein